jgi:acyl carrier protein
MQILREVTNMDILEKVKEIVSEQLNVEKEDIKLETTLKTWRQIL